MARATIRHVAEQAGVSTATVSRYLDGHRYISGKTKRQVQQALKKTGYDAHNRYKGNGNQKRTDNVGLLLLKEQRDFLRLPLFSQFLLAFDEVLAEEGMHLVIAHVSQDLPLPRTVSSERMDGMVLVGDVQVRPEWDLRNAIRVFGPVDGRFPSLPGTDVVTCDYVRGGWLAAAYLIERGHERLGYLNPWPGHRELNMIGEAFRDYGRRSGCAVEILAPQATSNGGVFSRDVLNPYRSGAIVDRLVAELLSLPGEARPTGLHVANDEVATLVYRSLAEHGVKVGEDVDIISRDNEGLFLSQLSPRPSSIELGCREIARQALNRILYHVSHPEAGHGLWTLVPPSVAEGEIVWQGGQASRLVVESVRMSD